MSIPKRLSSFGREKAILDAAIAEGDTVLLTCTNAQGEPTPGALQHQKLRFSKFAQLWAERTATDEVPLGSQLYASIQVVPHDEVTLAITPRAPTTLLRRPDGTRIGTDLDKEFDPEALAKRVAQAFGPLVDD